MQRASGKQKGPEKVFGRSVPRIEEGLNHVVKPDGLPVFQALLGSLPRDSEAVWIDAGNEASTYALAQADETLMERVEIGRAFTAFQHHSLVHRLEEFLDPGKDVVVLPGFDLLYLDGQIQEWEAEELIKESWRAVKKLRERHGLKVLVSTVHDSYLSRALEADTDREIEVRDTGEGWRFVSEGFDQMSYRDGRSVQTTLSCWSGRRKVEVKR